MWYDNHSSGYSITGGMSMNPFSNSNLKQCGWSKCDKGVYRGYHTPIEWTLHQQYVKVDLPPPIYPVQFQEVYESGNGYTSSDATPIQPTYTISGGSDNKWRILALGTMVAVWGCIIWSVLRLA